MARLNICVHAGKPQRTQFLRQAAAITERGVEASRIGADALWAWCKGWVTLNPTSKMAMDVLYALIDESYRAVVPKRVL
jgi:hypothetical protein